jgi:hypothetical protein
MLAYRRCASKIYFSLNTAFVDEVTQVSKALPYSPSWYKNPTRCTDVSVFKFPGQLVRSFSTKPYLRMGTAIAVSRGEAEICDVIRWVVV